MDIGYHEGLLTVARKTPLVDVQKKLASQP
jgi:hypothetical protein